MKPRHPRGPITIKIGDGRGPPPDVDASAPALDVGQAGAQTAGTDGAVPQGAGSQASGSVRAVVGRAALVIVAATLAGRLLGLVRDIVVAYFFGAGSDTDAFFLAYKVPYLLALVVSGALLAAFVPMFSQRISTGHKDEALALFVNMGKVAFLALLALTAILIVLAPWIIPLVGFGFSASTKELAVYLFRILMIGFVFAGLTGLVTGMLNSLRRFALAAFAPALGTVAVLLITVAFAVPLGITSLAIATAVGWVVGLVVVLFGIRDQHVQYRERIQWRDPALREAAGMVWPVFIGSAVGAVAIFSDQILGSLLTVGSVSSLSYADKLFQVPLGLFVAGITVPIFPLLSEQVAAHAPERVKATLSFALRLMAFLLIPCTVGFIVLRYAIIGLVLEHGKFDAADTTRTAWALLFLLLGLYAYAGRDTLTRVFYSYHDMRTPVAISVATVVVNIGLSYLLMHFLGVGGLALGTTVALTINFAVLLYLLRRKIGPMGLDLLARSFGRVAVASAAVGVVVWALDTGLSRVVGYTTGGNAVRVAGGAVTGLCTYFLAAKLMRSPELAEVKDMMHAVFRRS
jgi:putative peptidoglycan lipid II flippase